MCADPAARALNVTPQVKRASGNSLIESRRCFRTFAVSVLLKTRLNKTSVDHLGGVWCRGVGSAGANVACHGLEAVFK